MENRLTAWSPKLIEKYASPVPRYTSYPTAPHFSDRVNADVVCEWLDDIPQREPVSIYIHIPFCDRLCWFCGCHTKHTLKYEPIRQYLKILIDEIKLTAQIIGRRQPVKYLHLGGGSPSLLKPAELGSLQSALNESFKIDADTEISLEFDPTDLSASAMKSFIDFGLTRASLGVQDFDPLVQKTINRIQTFEQTAFVVDTFRHLGVQSINIDALYGLPHQSFQALHDTLRCVEKLDPDRIALFGYAHVPWIKPHQKLIPAESLPSTQLRFQQARFAESFLNEKGYQSIGIDHFAKQSDSLSEASRKRQIHRNFQGYTTDDCTTMLGFGASSISQFRLGYAQNVRDTHSYKRAIDAKQLPVNRGFKLQRFDQVTASAINELMCYFTLSPRVLREKFGRHADPLLMRAERLVDNDTDGLFIRDDICFRITDKGKPFARAIVAAFDEYLKTNQTQYSIAV